MRSMKCYWPLQSQQAAIIAILAYFGMEPLGCLYHEIRFTSTTDNACPLQFSGNNRHIMFSTKQLLACLSWNAGYWLMFMGSWREFRRVCMEGMNFSSRYVHMCIWCGVQAYLHMSSWCGFVELSGYDTKQSLTFRITQSITTSDSVNTEYYLMCTSCTSRRKQNITATLHNYHNMSSFYICLISCVQDRVSKQFDTTYYCPGTGYKQSQASHHWLMRTQII